MAEVYSHESPMYSDDHLHQNGAYQYSVELVKNIIPAVKTKRPWVTIKLGKFCVDHAIYFIHNNQHPEWYRFLADYKDIVAVVGVPETADKIRPYAEHVIYLPLSVDVEEVIRWSREKDKLVCYAGRKNKPGVELLDPKVVDMLYDMPRNLLLSEMARYQLVFAVGRTAIEAKCLGAQILPYDDRYPDPSIWKIVTNQEASEMLQKKLDAIDGK